MPYCRKCGTKLADDAQYCYNCGTSIIAPLIIPQRTYEKTPQKEVTHKSSLILPIMLITTIILAALIITTIAFTFFKPLNYDQNHINYININKPQLKTHTNIENTYHYTNHTDNNITQKHTLTEIHPFLTSL
jgi:uncharacterized membrane protein YvbJ